MYIEREVRELFRKVTALYSAVAVVGARQSGKTTFLKEMARGLNSSYVLFDDPDARALFEDDVKRFERQYVEGHEVTILDEVQYCKDAGAKLKYLIDMGRRIWITSSSEIILGKDILSYLVGRVSIIRLYPFSLNEFLAANAQKEVTAKILGRNVWEHTLFGGYPRVVMASDIEAKKIILRDLYDTMLLKDAARAFSIENISSLEVFARHLAINIGGLLSYEAISSDLKISFPTIKKYLDAMEKSYLIVRVKPFFTNKNKEIAKQPKIYFVDTGLRNSAAKAFDAEPEGRVFENYVLMELTKLGYAPKYWRSKSKAEVDFVVEKDKETIPIEVKLRAEAGRIERSLRSFIASYRPKRALVVAHKGEGGQMMVDGCKVIFTDVMGMARQIR